MSELLHEAMECLRKFVEHDRRMSAMEYYAIEDDMRALLRRYDQQEPAEASAERVVDVSKLTSDDQIMPCPHCKKKSGHITVITDNTIKCKSCGFIALFDTWQTWERKPAAPESAPPAPIKPLGEMMLFAKVSAINARVAGMVAENQFRQSCDQGIAYADDSFAQAESEINELCAAVNALRTAEGR